MSEPEYPTDMKMSFEIKDGKVFYEWKIGKTCTKSQDAITVDAFLTLATLIKMLDAHWRSKQDRYEIERRSVAS